MDWVTKVDELDVGTRALEATGLPMADYKETKG